MNTIQRNPEQAHGIALAYGALVGADVAGTVGGALTGAGIASVIFRVILAVEGAEVAFGPDENPAEAVLRLAANAEEALAQVGAAAVEQAGAAAAYV